MRFYIRERKQYSSIDQDILAAGNAGVEVVSWAEADGSLPDVGDVVQLGTRESLVYDGLRNPALDSRFVRNYIIVDIISYP